MNFPLRREQLLRGIAIPKIPEAVYNSNTIGNFALTLAETEKIIHQGIGAARTRHP